MKRWKTFCVQCGMPNPKENPYCFCSLDKDSFWAADLARDGEVDVTRLRDPKRTTQQRYFEDDAGDTRIVTREAWEDVEYLEVLS